MDPAEVGRLIEQGMTGAKVEVTGDGRHFEALVVSERFEGMSRIRRHQMVFAAVKDHLSDDAIHALSLKTYTPDDWARLQQPA